MLSFTFLILCRKLCSKLYFKAEAQQIDRILEVFANRYWTCNPDTILRTAGKLFLFACIYQGEANVGRF